MTTLLMLLLRLAKSWMRSGCCGTTLKNVVKLQNYYVPWELERELEQFVRWYNKERYHESLDNLTPQDVYLGRGREIQTARQRLKAQTLRQRKWYNQGRGRKKEAPIIPSQVRQGVY